MGLVTGACFANVGNQVICVDIDQDKVDALNAGQVPIYEPGLESYLSSSLADGSIKFTTDAAMAVQHGEMIFIGVGTPANEDGSADLQYVLNVASSIGTHMDGYKAVVNKSTVPVGSADLVAEKIQVALDKRGVDWGFSVASNPEFLKEGAALADFTRPDRIIVGTDSARVEEMMQELYGRYNLFALPGGNVGQELGLFSNKKASKMSDFKGMRIRTPGWYMDIMTQLGASVTPLPGGEVYLALERGVIDAAEFSTPAINYPMGFDDITKYVIQPGVHQPSCQSAFFINKDSYNKLPADLKWIVDIAAKETQQWSTAWAENLNAEAVKLFKKKVEFVRMDEAAITEFAKASHDYIEGLKAKYPDVKKVMDSQDQFKADFADWRQERGGVAVCG